MEKKLRIHGGKVLSGTVRMSGAKNAAVALIPASVLVGGKCFLENVPQIDDVSCICDIMTGLGAKISITDNGNMCLDTTEMSREIAENVEKTDENNGGEVFCLMRKMRASYYMLGALLGKYGYAKIATPGGCKIGERPMDLHVAGMRALGANVTETYVNCDGKIFHFSEEVSLDYLKSNGLSLTMVEASVPKGKRLKGTTITLPELTSVGATINLMLAAACAEGTTVIINAAREPHVINVVQFLNKIAGVKRTIVSSTNPDRFIISGISPDEFIEYPEREAVDVVADQIEAATYVLAAVGTGSTIDLAKIPVMHIQNLLSVLEDMHAIESVSPTSQPIHIVTRDKSEWCALPYVLATAPYPRFPTDMQQPFVAFLSTTPGISIVEECMFESRFGHVLPLKKMGANIVFHEIVCKDNRTGTRFEITGVTQLHAANVAASDLRAGAALIIAALMADGVTEISNIEFILRGYEDIVGKLRNLGADIELIDS